MKWDFLNGEFMYEANKTPEQNIAEYELAIGKSVAKPTFDKTAYHLSGTRTSDTVFTRGSGTWTASALIGQYCVAFVDSDTSDFSVHKITANATTTVTISTAYGDAALKTSANRIAVFETWEDAQAAIRYESVDNDIDVSGNLAVAGTLSAGATTITGAVIQDGGAVVINEAGADQDFRVESDTGTHAIFVNAGDNRVGIFTDTPTVPFQVTGNTIITGTLDVSGNIIMQNDEQIRNSTNGQIDIVGNLAIVGGTSGGLVIKAAEATATLTGATTDIDVDVPAGKVLLGTQLIVETAITSDTGATWAAAYKTGSAAAIVTAQAFTKNTKAGAFFNANGATAITSDVTKVVLSPNAGAFTAGSVRAITYYLDFVTLTSVA